MVAPAATRRSGGAAEGRNFIGRRRGRGRRVRHRRHRHIVMRRGTELIPCAEPNLFDHPAAEATAMLVEHGGLARRGGALRRLEFDPGAAIGTYRDAGRLTRLAVAQLDAGLETADASGTQPVERSGRHSIGLEPMLLVPLHYGQCVARAVLVSDVPRLLGTAARAADCEPGALPESVKRQAAVLSEHATRRRFDRAGDGLQ